jgi:membrane associated rhomboid family serine protease
VTHILHAPEPALRRLQHWVPAIARDRQVVAETAPEFRKPWLTLGLFLLVAVVILWQTAWPPLIDRLQWNAVKVGEGEVWRLVTGLLVHTNGQSQIVVNMATLLALGSFVEQRWPRIVWLAAFFAGAFSAEAAGVHWYPVGGGMSVGLWGLFGLTLAGALTNPEASLPVRIVWPALGCAAGLLFCFASDIHGPPVFAGALVGFTALALGTQPLSRSSAPAHG